MTDYPNVPPRLTRNFGNNPLFFVTFCSHRRKNILATNSVNAAFLEFARKAYALQSIEVGRYVIMPDHLHLFVCGPDDFELGRWIGMLKQRLGKGPLILACDDFSVVAATISGSHSGQLPD